MTGDVLVLAGSPERVALLGTASRVGPPVAVVVGAEPVADDDLTALAAAGATAVVSVVAGTGWEPATGAGRVARLLAGLARERGATAVLLPDDRLGRQVAALLGLALDTGVVTGVTALDAGPLAHKPVLGGEATATARTDGVLVATVAAGTAADAGTATATSAEATVASGSTTAPRTTDGPAADRPEHLVVPLPDGDRRVRVVGREPLPATGRPRLTDAEVVVAAGRGLAGDLRPVEDLADALGAAVAGSRAAVDAGWLPHAAQVGQTGATIAPRVYVAAGISGALQHLAGIRGARTVVAVTTDPDAPILAVADLGIVGDAFTVLPQATAALLEGGSRG